MNNNIINILRNIIIPTILSLSFRFFPLFYYYETYLVLPLILWSDHWFYWFHRITHKLNLTFHTELHHKKRKQTQWIELWAIPIMLIFEYLPFKLLFPIYHFVGLYCVLTTHLFEHLLAHISLFFDIKNSHYFHHTNPDKYQYGSANPLWDILYKTYPWEINSL